MEPKQNYCTISNIEDFLNLISQALADNVCEAGPEDGGSQFGARDGGQGNKLVFCRQQFTGKTAVGELGPGMDGRHGDGLAGVHGDNDLQVLRQSLRVDCAAPKPEVSDEPDIFQVINPQVQVFRGDGVIPPQPEADYFG